ncbi:MAG: hypothetical protein IJP94_08380 [Clostridia bacterium]|nr:hypothetical protein [Clostridia bacterium]MBQ9598781.1 hypothetical protein [Clostridia bacterium]MBR0089839.1 hypothetical protein [Clostridia bacterium]
MEELFEQLKEQAAKMKDGAIRFTQKVIGKTNNVVDQTKVKLAISDTESKMEEIFTKIGGSVYKSHTDGTKVPDFTEVFAKLDELKNELDDLKEQLCRLQDTKQCPKCNTYNDQKNEYCAKCGNKFGDVSGEETKTNDDDTFTVEADTAEVDTVEVDAADSAAEVDAK